jgi:hypothetical protein
MNDLLEKLLIEDIEEDFEDVFEPVSDEEALRREEQWMKTADIADIKLRVKFDIILGNTQDYIKFIDSKESARWMRTTVGILLREKLLLRVLNIETKQSLLDFIKAWRKVTAH